MHFRPALLLVTALLLVASARAEDVLIVEQEYSIVELDKDAKPRDIKQKLYLTKDWIRIDEFAGQGGAPSETFLIDFKNENIVNLDNQNMVKTEESFGKRRERIDARKEKIREDLREMPDSEKEKTARMYKALLDDDRKFAMAKGEKEERREILNATCDRVVVYDKKEKTYEPMTVFLHPEIEVPYDNAEVLYLLQIIGRKTAEYLRENKKTFRKLPMEMDLELAAGGHLHTKVLSVEKTGKDKLDPALNQIPDGYKEPKRKSPGPPKPVKAGD